MKAPGNGFIPNTAEEGRVINSELWHACAGPLISIPPVGSLVVYFPQGHSEQVAASMQKETDSIPSYPNLPSKLICILQNVTLQADLETDEVYAQMTIQPVNKYEREALLASEMGLKQSRQPAEFFCKTLTASDTSTHGGFSVPRRAAEKIFPPLDFSMQPPCQELVAKDLHSQAWTFRHIYRGQPKRHLLTTGWSVFVSSKRLFAGDSVLFIRDEKSQLLLGIRRANKQQPVLASSVISSDSMHIGVFAAAAHAAANNSAFTIFYNPRASPAEFVVPLAKYNKALYTQIAPGMRFRMMVETEECGVRRYMGTVTGISDLDAVRWKNSQWRSLQVGWDESTAGERPSRVSIWDIEPVVTPFYICPPPFFRPKFSNQQGLPDCESDMESIFKRGMPWIGDEFGRGDVPKSIFPGLSLVQWMNMQQQNNQFPGAQPWLFPSTVSASALHAGLGVDDPSKLLNFQSPSFSMPSLQFNKASQQNQLGPSQQHHLQNILQNPLNSQQQQQQQPKQQPQPPQQQQQQQPQQLQQQQQPQPFQQQQQQFQQQQQPQQFQQQQQQFQQQHQQLFQQQQLHQLQQQHQRLLQNPLNSQQQVLQEQQQSQKLQQQQQLVAPQKHLIPQPTFVNSGLVSPNQNQNLPINKDHVLLTSFAPDNQFQQQRPPALQNVSDHQLQFQMLQKLQQQPHQQSYQLSSPVRSQVQSQVRSQPHASQNNQLLQNQPTLPVMQLPGIQKTAIVRSQSGPPDGDAPSCSTSPSTNNAPILPSSFLNHNHQGQNMLVDLENGKLLQDLQERSADIRIKSAVLSSKVVEPPRFNSTIGDPLEASSSVTSYGLNASGHQRNLSLPNFGLDGDVQSHLRNSVPLSTAMDSLIPDTLLSRGFDSGKELHNLLSDYNGGSRDVETELSAAALSSQTFGVPDIPFKSACSNDVGINDPSVLGGGIWPSQTQRLRTYTKVQKRGSVGRSIDVTRYKGYDELRRDLGRMFGIESMEDPQRTDWKLVYVDHENDILLVGDDPWDEFVNCVQSIKILSSAEVQQMSLDGDFGNEPMPKPSI